MVVSSLFPLCLILGYFVKLNFRDVCLRIRTRGIEYIWQGLCTSPILNTISTWAKRRPVLPYLLWAISVGLRFLANLPGHGARGSIRTASQTQIQNQLLLGSGHPMPAANGCWSGLKSQKRRILHLNPRKKQLIFLFFFLFFLFEMGILRGFQGARACWVCRSTRKGTLSCTARRGFCPGREVQSKSSKAETWEWAPTTGCMSAMSQDYTEYPKMPVRIGERDFCGYWRWCRGYELSRDAEF